MWGKNRSLEAAIARVMGYEYCVLFPRARDAIWNYALVGKKSRLPSNVCPELQRAIPWAQIHPIDPATGLAAGVAVQLYGFRQTIPGHELEIDPLMTGFLDRPFALHCVISFGRNKTLGAGGGGAFLTNDNHVVKNFMRPAAYFPAGLIDRVHHGLQILPDEINRRFDRMALWDRHLGDSCIRIPREQIMPWRVIRRIPEKRDAVVRALRRNGFDAGTNYPPLPGVTDPGAIQWGNEVINLFLSGDYDEPRVQAACELIKRTLASKPPWDIP